VTDEEAFAAYAEWCGITVDELLSYLDCYESRKLVGLTDPYTPPQRQIALLMAGSDGP
jgi:hypothetical protein